MRSTSCFESRAKAASFLASATCITGMACAAGIASCIIAPPQQVPDLPQQRPTILHGSVYPPEDEYLTPMLLGGEFLIPIQLIDPNQSFSTQVVIDQTPVPGTSRQYTPTPATTLQGGIYNVEFTLPSQNIDLGMCHDILFLVADSFNAASPLSAGDSFGSDQANWFYVPPGSNGCYEYDAGDAAPADAPADGLLLIPDSVAPL
jgi:hypothetical protein